MRTYLKFLAFFPALAFAQTQEGYHEHDGFYLSMNAGPAFGPITLTANNGPIHKLEYSGPGAIVDFKIGGTIKKTLSLSFDVISRDIVGPDVKVDSVKGSSSSDYSANDITYGLGATYYFMPINIFLSGTVGIGVFQFKDELNKIDAKSKSGLGMQVKVGKEWWVGKDWGLGVSGGIGLVAAKDQDSPDYPDYSGKLSTSKFFVMFNTTYN